MTRLQAERERRGWSRAEASRRSRLAPTLYGWIENGRYLPYPRELTRIADALSFSGRAAELLDPVSCDAQ